MKSSPRSSRPKPKSADIGRRAWFAIAVAVLAPFVTMFALKAIAARAPEWATLWLRVRTAAVASLAIRAVGVPVTLSEGTALVLRNHVLRIDLACTAFDWFILFAVVVAVVPVTTQKKMVALMLGLPAIVLLNVIRLVAVALVSEYSPRQFVFVHDVVLQASIAVLVASMWVAFLWTSRGDWKSGWN